MTIILLTMNQDFYKQALFALRVEIAALTKEREGLDARRIEIEQRLAQLDQTEKGLILLSGEKVDIKPSDLSEMVKGLGLADACRAALRARDRFLTPISLRATLEFVGYDFGNQANPLASIHAILKRFVESGEAEALEVEGKVGYRLRQTPIDKKRQTSPVVDLFVGQGSTPSTASSKKVPGKAKNKRLRQAQERPKFIQDPLSVFDKEEGKK
jgi:hypothetical protein